MTLIKTVLVKPGINSEHHRAITHGKWPLALHHHKLNREVLVLGVCFFYESPFMDQGYREGDVFCLFVKSAQTPGPARVGTAGSLHTIRSSQPSDSPAGQDPNHVVGLVPFNTHCTVVKIGLRLLQQKQQK